MHTAKSVKIFMHISQPPTGYEISFEPINPQNQTKNLPIT